MEIITMDNEVVKTMMEKIDRIEDTATDAKGQDYFLHDGEKQMPVQTDGSGGMRETENRTLQSQDAGGVQA